MLGTIILGILLNGDFTVYEIKKIIERGVGVFFKASYGSLYPAVNKLLDKGYVTMREESQGERKRKIYSITKSGTDVFMNWLQTPLDLSDNDSNNLSKIYFFDKLPYENREQQLAEYELSSTNYLRKLQELETQFAARKDIKEHYFKMSTLYYGICVVQQTIKWCQYLRENKSLKDLLD